MDKKLNVLILPFNIASMPSITVKALKDRGHHAVGLIIQNDIKQSADGLEVYNYSKTSVTKYYTMFRWYIRFLQLIFWADIVHWTGGFSKGLFAACAPIIKLRKIPAVVEFLGSDVRDPQIEFSTNPYYTRAYYNGYEYPYETTEHAQSNQRKFASSGFSFIALMGMKQYILPQYYANTYLLNQRIDLTNFEFNPPSIEKSKPIIVHSPSAPVCKGTAYVLEAINELKLSNEFEFILIQNMPHHIAKAHIQKCDIFVDQLAGGCYGMASMEAMAYGKPVICYLKQSLVETEVPTDCPIVNGNPDTITQQLQKLLNDATLRNKLGQQGRIYVEKYHDVNTSVPELIDVYKSVHNQHHN